MSDDTQDLLEKVATIAFRGSVEQQERWCAAFARAQLNFHTPEKSGHGKVGNNSDFAFSTKADLLAAVRPALAAEGLCILQPASNMSRDSEVAITTAIVGHGAIFASTVSFSKAALLVPEISEYKLWSAVKAWGGAVSYLTRYCLQSMLALAGDDEHDPDTMASPPQEPAKGRSRRNPPQETAAQAQKPPKPKDAVTEHQLSDIGALFRALGIGPPESYVQTRKMAEVAADFPIQHLPQAKAKRIIDALLTDAEIQGIDRAALKLHCDQAAPGRSTAPTTGGQDR